MAFHVLAWKTMRQYFGDMMDYEGQDYGYITGLPPGKNKTMSSNIEGWKIVLCNCIIIL